MSHLTHYASTITQNLEACEVTNGFDTGMELSDAIQETLAILTQIKESNNKCMLIGNGGSAAIAAHMQNDLLKACQIRSLVHTESSILTALTNDNGYETAFEQQIQLWADPGDLLIAISSSGQSENILRACGAAQRNGVSVITLSGFSGSNTLRQLGEINFHIPSEHYGTVELCHSILCHYMTDTFTSINAHCIRVEQAERVTK
jgi:D-sedoheptulose 7-phosphate isomerase